jgi:hypothetical protein
MYTPEEQPEYNQFPLRKVELCRREKHIKQAEDTDNTLENVLIRSTIFFTIWVNDAVLPTKSFN